MNEFDPNYSYNDEALRAATELYLDLISKSQVTDLTELPMVKRGPQGREVVLSRGVSRPVADLYRLMKQKRDEPKE